jgi:hypothetical protein
VKDAPSAAWTALTVGPNRVAVDPSIGNIRELRLSHGGRSVAPLHTAEWVGAPGGLPEDLLPVERDLAGDFLCAPFGASDVETAPAHGWPANSRWDVAEGQPGSLRLVLQRDVFGARIEKRLRLVADAPILYQEHLVTGGSGGLTVAHHPMVRVAGGARFSCSRKRAILTADVPLDPGRNRLAAGATATSLTEVPAVGGGVVDLTELPIADQHEDFVTLVEAEGAAIGWSAVVREAEDDVIFVLKDARVLPVTMLWHSNGGRDYPPWNGRHRGVLGIEDGCAAGAAGHAAALAPNRVAAQGVPTALALAPGSTHRIAHATGAFARPPGWTRVADIRIEGAACLLTGDDGTTVALPFDPDFFAEAR